MGRIFGIFVAALLLTTYASADETAPAATTAAAVEGHYGDIVYGDVNAPIEIIEYASTTCPHCATFAATVMPTIKEKYIDTGKARLVYRNFVMNRVDLAASTISRCSNEETAKKLMKVLFARQRDWVQSKDPITALASIARKVGISRVKFDRCLANTDMHKHLVEMTQGGQKTYGVNATPTLIVNGAKVDVPSLENLIKVLDDQ